MAGLGPRVLQVLEFASTHAPELQALHELSQHDEVTTEADGKMQTQRNQRRRRANAFKSHKMPQRLRATAKSKHQGTERCRQHERRPHKLLESRSMPADGDPERPVWLPSHLWHAKRMIMKEKFGYMLATRRADKSVSAALKALRSKMTLHDASYYGVIELYGLPQVILEALQLVSDPSGSDFHGLKFLAGKEEGRSMIYHEGMFPKGAIAPVTFMWRPLKVDYAAGEEFKLHEDWQNTKRQLWIWVHPAAYMEAATAIGQACQAVVGEEEEGIQMLDRRGHLARLKLRGKLADEMIAGLVDGKEVDSNVDQEMEEEAISDHEDGFSEQETMDTCNQRNRRNLLRILRRQVEKSENVDAMYSVTVKDPRLARWRDGRLSHRPDPVKSNLSLLQEPPGSAVPEIGSAVIESPLSGTTLSSHGKDAEEPESEVILNELQALLSWTTSSATAESDDSVDVTYPRTAPSGSRLDDSMEVDEDTKRETSPSSLLWSLSKRDTLKRNFLQDHKLNEGVYRKRKQGIFSSGSDNAMIDPQPLHLLVIKRSHPYPNTSGWDIICPPANVPNLLNTLVFSGALVLGLDEDAALSTALHQCNFPCDYPDTQAGQNYWQDRATELKVKQAKKPKAKRVNFAKRGVTSPFQPDWSLLFSEQPSGIGSDDVNSPFCVLRGDKYAEPFNFYSVSKNTDTDASAAPASEEIVPVPLPTLIRVVVTFPRRGNVAANSLLFAPSDEDQKQFYGDSSWQGCEVELGKRCKTKTETRQLVGFVTSAIYDRPKAAFRAIGFCACEPLERIFSRSQSSSKTVGHTLAMLQCPQGRMLRPVLVKVQV